MFFPSSKNGFVRMGVASNPSTLADTLKVLATDEVECIRKRVASNPNFK